MSQSLARRRDGCARRIPSADAGTGAPPTRSLADLAERAARAAGRPAARPRGPRRGRRGVEIERHRHGLGADRASEELLVDLLTTARPEDGLIGEEGTRATGTTGLTWVCDPLDGTTNYLYGFPQWAVFVAVEDRRRAARRVRLRPVARRGVHGRAGHGATLNGRRSACRRRASCDVADRHRLRLPGVGARRTGGADERGCSARCATSAAPARPRSTSRWVACGRARRVLRERHPPLGLRRRHALVPPRRAACSRSDRGRSTAPLEARRRRGRRSTARCAHWRD